MDELEIIDKKLGIVQRYGININKKTRQLAIRIESLKNNIRHNHESISKELKQIKQDIKEMDEHVFIIGNMLSMLVEKDKLEKIKEQLLHSLKQNL